MSGIGKSTVLSFKSAVHTGIYYLCELLKYTHTETDSLAAAKC